MHIIAPSLLAADFSNLQNDLTQVTQSQATWLHLDIMDGVFVPNISFGTPILEAIRPYTKHLFLDMHLMIVQPERYVEDFKHLGANMITVHYEACMHLHRTLQHIKSLGVKAGVALNPHTPVEVLEDILQDADLVCLMSVNPGFGGQSFIENTYKKIQKLRKMIDERGLNTLIEIDGGINLKNATAIKNAGAEVLVAGNCVFRSDNIIQTIADLYKL